MATRLPAVEINVGWVDATQSRGLSRTWRRSTDDTTAVDAAVVSLCAELAAASDCAITEYTAKWQFWRSDERPSSGVDSNHGALFVFETAIAGEYMLLPVVGVRPTYTGDDGLIDITQPDIAAIGNAAISLGYCNPFGSVATVLVAVIPTLKPFPYL